MGFRSGDVLQVTWEKHPIRVITGDDIEVFYDVLLPNAGWNLAGVQTAAYYRAASHVISASAQLIGADPLLDDELNLHRPDLPMRMLRCREAAWGEPLRNWPSIDTAFDIAAKRLALVPFGQKGGPQRPVVVEAADGCLFSGHELLVSAHRFQSASCADVHGVGLYRSGIIEGLPSYYAWGWRDRAGNAC